MKLGQDAMLAEAGEENECINDITGEELLWQAVKQVREKELMNLACSRRLMSEAMYNVTPVDTKWVDIDKAFGGSQCKSVHALLPEGSKVETGQTCMR